MNVPRRFYSNLFGGHYNSYGQDDFPQIKGSANDDWKLVLCKQGIRVLLIRKSSVLSAPSLLKILGRLKQEYRPIRVTENRNSPSAGWLVKFLDTEGNIVFVVQYNYQ